MKKLKVHKVKKGEHCYYCSVCKMAAGDGDGFVGQKCEGKPKKIN